MAFGKKRDKKEKDPKKKDKKEVKKEKKQDKGKLKRIQSKSSGQIQTLGDKNQKDTSNLTGQNETADHFSDDKVTVDVPVLCRAEAICAYEPEMMELDSDITFLRFNKGDMIDVIERDPTGWWEGIFDGVLGIFPGTYVRVIEIYGTEDDESNPSTGTTSKISFENQPTDQTSETTSNPSLEPQNSVTTIQDAPDRSSEVDDIGFDDYDDDVELDLDDDLEPHYSENDTQAREVDDKLSSLIAMYGKKDIPVPSPPAGGDSSKLKPSSSDPSLHNHSGLLDDEYNHSNDPDDDEFYEHDPLEFDRDDFLEGDDESTDHLRTIRKDPSDDSTKLVDQVNSNQSTEDDPQIKSLQQPEQQTDPQSILDDNTEKETPKHSNEETQSEKEQPQQQQEEQEHEHEKEGKEKSSTRNLDNESSISPEEMDSELYFTQEELKNAQLEVEIRSEEYRNLKAKYSATISDLIHAQNQLASRESALLESNSALSELRNELASLKSLFHKALSERTDALNQVKEQQHSLREAISSLSRSRNELDAALALNGSLQEEKEQLSLKLQSALNESSNQSSRLSDLQSEVTHLKQQLSESQANNVAAQINGLQSRLEETEARLAVRDEALREKNASLQSLESQKAALQTQLNSAQAQIRDLLSTHGEQLSQQQQRLEDSVSELADLKQQLIQSREREISLSGQISRLDAENRSLKLSGGGPAGGIHRGRGGFTRGRRGSAATLIPPPSTSSTSATTTGVVSGRGGVNRGTSSGRGGARNPSSRGGGGSGSSSNRAAISRTISDGNFRPSVAKTLKEKSLDQSDSSTGNDSATNVVPSTKPLVSPKPNPNAGRSLPVPVGPKFVRPVGPGGKPIVRKLVRNTPLPSRAPPQFSPQDSTSNEDQGKVESTEK